MPIYVFVSALTFALFLTATAELPQQNPANTPRDRAPVAGEGTGIIRGRVTDRENGQPLARVTVTIESAAWLNEELSWSMTTAQSIRADYSGTKRNEPRTTITAADGRFEFRKILAGAYYVYFDASMTRGTHLDQRFGELVPRDPLRKGRRVPPIDIRDGETRENVDVALWRALAIDGRVVDDAGEPVANANVNISSWETPSSMSVGRPRETDDRGMFRFFGLAPGHYRICATAERLGPSEETSERFIRTCYPNVVNEGDAQPLVLSTAESGQIEIRLQRNRTYKITGIAIDSSGAPIADGSVELVAMTSAGGSSSSVPAKPDGQFALAGVAPGNYAVLASTGGRHVPGAVDKYNPERGYVSVRVEAADVDGLVVTTSKAAKVAGRLVFEGGLPEQEIPKLSIVTSPDEMVGSPFGMLGQWSEAAVREDMSFELEGLFGPVFLTVMGGPRGWIVKSVKYRGDDVTDRAIAFRSSSDPRLLEVTVTNQGAILTGRVVSDDDRTSSVVLLPADLSQWRPFPGPTPIQTRTDGTFTIGPLRAGEYVVAGVIGMLTTNLLEPSARAEFAERIAKHGERITLVENEKRSIDLRAVKMQ